MGFEREKTVEDVLKRIFTQEYLMPAIQREFVWNTDKIVGLFDSLLRGYPVGSFLFWNVEPSTAEDYVFYGFLRDYHEKDSPYATKQKVPTGQGTIAILDGQQRLTSLNIGLYGSHATKRLWGRRDSAHAYPVKRLYLNLVDSPPENEELGLMYDLRFLARDEAMPAEGAPDRWFLVGDVLKLEDDPVAYMDAVADRGISDVREGVRRLTTLYAAIRKTSSMNYYLVEDQQPDRVLEIFIRINSAGQELSKSDLLLSMATNQWSTEPGAREEVRSLVSELNDRGFNFSKDFVLKAALMMVGVDVRFEVSNITRANIEKIETSWQQIRAALLLTVDVLKHGGFSAPSLSANNAALVLAYYLYKRSATDSYLDSSHTSSDRESVLRWLTRSLLKQGVWGSNPDTLLTRLRAAIDQTGTASGFPVSALESAMAALGKALSFDEAEIEELLASQYGGRGTFGLLSLLYPGLDLSKTFHEDHIFPKSLFNSKALQAAGVPLDDIPRYLESYNSLPNLQLLTGTRNTEKLAMLPADWVRDHFDSDDKRWTYLQENNLDGLSLELSDFLAFVEARRNRTRDRLGKVLGLAIANPTMTQPTSADSS